MRKNLIAVLVTLGLGGAAAAAIIGTSALAQQAPAPGTPMLLAQAAPAPARGRGPNARGLSRNMARPAPTAAQQTARRTELCQDGYARAAGRFATLEVRLNLTGAQSAAFARWRDLRLAAAKQRAGECAARPLRQPGAARGANATPPSPVERLTREETMLQRRLADIQAERPALDALYGSLNATQRQVLARGAGGFGRGGRPGMGMARNMGGPRGRMMMRRGPMGMGGRGPMGGRMNGPMGNQGNPPPPPPPQ